MSSLLTLDLESLELTLEERELLKHPLVGGVILFSRNYVSSEQLEQLIQQIRTASPRYILISVDQEGGRVQRFRQNFTRLPPAALYGKLYNQNKDAAKKLTQQAGWLMAAELLAYQIDFSFAPVLDIASDLSEVIGDRAFHHDPFIVAELAGAFCAGMRSAGMSTLGKHFPGHGLIAADSHTEIPIDTRAYSALDACDLVPFKQLVSNSLDGIMPAHIIYSQMDKKPAGFSHYWLQNILRQQLNFQGAILSDDLSMEGASVVGNMVDRAKQAFSAGCDMVLVCNNRVGAIEVLDGLGDYHQPEAEQRLTRMRARTRYQRKELQQMPAWKEVTKNLAVLYLG